jgi:cytochrome c oxidase cbb3-type subunit 3
MNELEFTFTSNFWNIWIIVLTLANVFGCWWLIAWTSKKRAGEAQSGDVTGHTWDEGLAEYNNPLPRWWLWLFHITLVFGLVYFALYPGLGTFKGMLGWSPQGQYAKEMATADEKYGPLFAQFAAQPIETLAGNEDALKIGQRLFVNYCASCHGSDAGGGPGFPNLRDGAWLYGGTPDAIKTSILDGRNGAMPAWGAALQDKGVDEVTAYVISLSGRDADAAKVAAGKTHFETYCVACHGAEGKGNPALGAPDLTDDVWLYGASPGVIRQTINEGRNGRMPPHRDFLGEDKVHLLATYIYSLSN